MKKTIAVAATLAMAAALSMTAFAADHVTGPEEMPTLAHEQDSETFWDGDWVKEPTCTEGGIWRFPCAEEDGKFHEVVVEAWGHAWSSEWEGSEWGKVTKEPTCTEEGEAVDYCIECGAIREGGKTRTIAKVPHEFKEEKFEDTFKKATCKADGKSEKKYHNVCKNCGAVEKDSKGKEIVRVESETWKWTDPGEKADDRNETHKWDKWIHEKAATCDKEGVDIRWCQICGAKEQKAVPVLEPEWKVKSTKMLNCYEEEVTYTCAKCEGKNNEEHKAKVEVKETKAHTFASKPDEELSVKPTCNSWGYDVYPCVHFDDGDSDKHSHTDVVKTVVKKNEDLGKMHTTTIEYLDGYKIVELKPLGHNWTDWVERHKGDESTYWLRTCKTCGATEEQISTDKPTQPVYPSVEKNGLVKDEDGTWRLYKDDKVNDKFTGIYEYNGGEFFINKGVLDEKANGLNLIDGTWYFLAQGQVQRTDGFAEYDDNWFMIKNGELDEKANGLYTYKTDEGEGVFLFAAGRLRTDVNGLWQDAYGTYGEAGKWYFLANGQVVDYTGVAEYNGAFFVVEKGVFNNEYNGTIEYDGATFNVVAGQLYDQVKTAEVA
ncbi:MAG: hypothetical protein Q4C02_03315 [Eubacteriales bacterium]|nr:hypothetical protein [Eubacteriales bacterium]